MNVAQLLAKQAAIAGERAAIIDYPRGRQRVRSFRELAADSLGIAAQLAAAGLCPGDSVLVLVPMSAELYAVLNALFRLGLVAQFLDPAAGRHHIDACCALKAPRAFIGSAAAHGLRCLASGLRRIPLKFTTSGWVPGARRLHWNVPPQREPALVPCTAATPALLRFTSGSTGQPKAAVRTHGFLREQQRVIEQSLVLSPGDVDLSTLPIFVLANLASGVTSVIPHANLRAPGRIDAAPVVAQFKAHQPNRVSASPALLLRLAEHCARTGETLGSLKWVFTGGAPVFPQVMDRLQEMAPRAEIIAVYGSTEAEPIAKLNRREITSADRMAMLGGSGLLAGRPDPAIDLRILHPETRSSDSGTTACAFAAPRLPMAAIGEVIVSGPHVQPGYLNGMGDHETKLKIDGVTWHKTGDAGYLDLHGRLWLLGRCQARIEDAVGTLYPFQVECAALQHPAVRRAALLAHRRQRWLIVELQKGAKKPGLSAELSWAHLDHIEFVREIPVDPRHNAKIDYPSLHKMLRHL